jgi:hypothetical protein
MESTQELPSALVTHCVVVGIDTESLPAPDTEAQAAEIPHELLSADVLHAFPLSAIATPTGAVPPLPDSVALFCLPAGVIAKRSGEKDADKIKFFSFVLTNMDGSRSFGTCVAWYEPLEKYPGADLDSPARCCFHLVNPASSPFLQAPWYRKCYA